MELLLWRHAEALDGIDDLQRPLSLKGQQQASKMAAWLGRHGPGGLRLLVSPAARTRETAKAFRQKMEVSELLAPGCQVQELVTLCQWPLGPAPVLLVGHQPSLGLLTSLLLTGQPMPWAIKKGALWWLSSRTRAGEQQCVIRTVLAPELL